MWFFLTVAIGFLAIVLVFLAFEDWQFLRRPRRRAQGTVFDHRRSTDEGSEYFSPMVRFVTLDGKTIEITDTFGLSSRHPSLGSQLEVVYPIEMPEKARIRRPWLRVAIYGGVIVAIAILIARGIGIL
jgi:Protein of unknown function (DUF3592)